MVTKKFLTELTFSIISVAIEVHKTLGPGLLESVYHQCMEHEFMLRGINIVSECNVPVIYKEVHIATDLRCDFLVEDVMLVDIKAINTIPPIHFAKLLSYMKLLEKPKGIIINFNCMNIFREGQHTRVNEFYTNLPEE
ncbi:MAG TPA: GxxExxY protein [Bacteroidia bacterium]|nr:GxxExxY protein [Bacteroidia bacterium]